MMGITEELPYQPEPMAELQGRYKRALLNQFDATAVVMGDAPGPEVCRANIFDTESGLRIGIWIQIFPNGAWFLCVKAEPMTGRFGNAHYLMPGGLDRFSETAITAFQAISGDLEPLEALGSGWDGWPTWWRHIAGPRFTPEQLAIWTTQWRRAVLNHVLETRV